MSHFSERLSVLHKRIIDAQQQFGRAGDEITLLAVSKMQTITTIRAAIQEGLMCFGENYLQEALPKIMELKEYPLDWHFIGTVQRNKTRLIAMHFNWVHTLSNCLHAERLNNQRPHYLPPLNVCIEVNISNDPGKSGANIDEVKNLAEYITHLPRLRLRGLMVIPRPEKVFEKQRIPFNQLKKMFLQLQQEGFRLDTLSMGMSDDLEAAIAEGATIIRIGTALFGERKTL